jgi:hypothetical protein
MLECMTVMKLRHRNFAGRAIRLCTTLLMLVFGDNTAVALPAGICFAQAQSSKHAIAITFDYDFTAMHACSPKVSKKCIAKFVVYDISGKKPYKLFTIPVPADATGPVKGISGQSEPLLFESGKHQLAVTAQKDSGEESSTYACSVWITIP